MTKRYMKILIADFESDTLHLTVEEDGVYNRLLRLCCRTSGGSIPDDEAWIRARIRVDQETYTRVVRPILEEFFTRRKGRFQHARSNVEMRHA